MSIVAPPSAEEAAKHGVRSAVISANADTSILGELAKLIDSGKLKPIVQTVLPRSEARKAHELNESGHARGKIVLKVAQHEFTGRMRRSRCWRRLVGLEVV